MSRQDLDLTVEEVEAGNEEKRVLEEEAEEVRSRVKGLGFRLRHPNPETLNLSNPQTLKTLKPPRPSHPKP
jgi:hypothetical protein